MHCSRTFRTCTSTPEQIVRPRAQHTLEYRLRTHENVPNRDCSRRSVSSPQRWSQTKRHWHVETYVSCRWLPSWTASCLQAEAVAPATLVELFRVFGHETPASQEAPRVAVAIRPCDPGRAGHAAMPPRLRQYPPNAAPPMLAHVCKLCEASYSTQEGIDEHITWVHGGMVRYRETWLFLERCQPHATSPQEQRAAVENFSFCYRYGARRRYQSHIDLSGAMLTGRGEQM